MLQAAPCSARDKPCLHDLFFLPRAWPRTTGASSREVPSACPLSMTSPSEPGVELPLPSSTLLGPCTDLGRRMHLGHGPNWADIKQLHALIDKAVLVPAGSWCTIVPSAADDSTDGLSIRTCKISYQPLCTHRWRRFRAIAEDMDYKDVLSSQLQDTGVPLQFLAEEDSSAKPCTPRSRSTSTESRPLPRISWLLPLQRFCKGRRQSPKACCQPLPLLRRCLSLRFSQPGTGGAASVIRGRPTSPDWETDFVPRLNHTHETRPVGPPSTSSFSGCSPLGSLRFGVRLFLSHPRLVDCSSLFLVGDMNAQLEADLPECVCGHACENQNSLGDRLFTHYPYTPPSSPAYHVQ